MSVIGAVEHVQNILAFSANVFCLARHYHKLYSISYYLFVWVFAQRLPRHNGRSVCGFDWLDRRRQRWKIGGARAVFVGFEVFVLVVDPVVWGSLEFLVGLAWWQSWARWLASTAEVLALGIRFSAWCAIWLGWEFRWDQSVWKVLCLVLHFIRICLRYCWTLLSISWADPFLPQLVLTVSSPLELLEFLHLLGLQGISSFFVEI